jgi:hypothetical protein
MKHKLLAALLIVASLGAMTACPSVPVKPVEEMSASDFKLLCDSTTLVSKVTTSILIRNGNISRETALKLSADIELILSDPLTAAGPNFLTEALKKAGVSDQDALTVLETVELFIRLRFDVGTNLLPLTPRMLELGLSVASGVRMAAVVGLDPSDEQAADKLLKEAHAAK